MSSYERRSARGSVALSAGCEFGLFIGASVCVSLGAAASGGVRQNLEKSFLGGMAFLSGDASTSNGNELRGWVDPLSLTTDETDSDRKVNLVRLAVEERSVIMPGTLFLRGVSDVLPRDR